jgi:hypothetical protein
LYLNVKNAQVILDQLNSKYSQVLKNSSNSIKFRASAATVAQQRQNFLKLVKNFKFSRI